MNKVIVVLLVWCASALAGVSAFARTPQVVFISPGEETGADVWAQIPRFMRVAADQFGFKFDILYASRDRHRMLDLAREVAQRINPPDYVLLVNEQLAAAEMMEYFRSKPTRILLFHNDLTAEQRQQLGNERERLPNWIGTLVFAQDATPHAMMRALYRKSTAVPRIVGIAGDRATPISAMGEASVRKFIADAKHGELLQVVPGNWRRADAAEKALGLLQRYPDVNMIWAANDAMALGAMDAVVAANRAGSVLVGGMGAFPDAIDSVARGGMAATAGGGALLGGALCMVLIHDHAAGRDFAEAGGVQQVNGIVIPVSDAASARRYQEFISNPSHIDFRRLARKQGGTYRFNADALFEAAKRP